MFHDSKRGVIWGISRALMTWTAVAIVPPFAIAALAPVLLMILPVALVALPFLLFAFAPGAAGHRHDSARIAAWRPASAALT